MIESQPIALFFPGQGPQHPGMGIDYYNHSPRAQAVFDHADHLAKELGLGYQITRLCFQDPGQELSGPNINTAKIQPAILTVNIAIYTHLKAMGLIDPSYAAGHSAGKLIAAVASGSLTFDQGFELMVRRGEEMKNSSSTQDGVVGIIDTGGKEVPGMDQEQGLLGIVTERLASLGAAASSFRPTVENSMTQVMFAGLRHEVAVVMNTLDEIPHRMLKIYEGAPVSHSPLVEDAQQGFNRFVEAAREHVENLNFPLIDDRRGLVITTPAEFINSLTDHLTEPISWRKSVMRSVEKGVTIGIEVGPGQVLRGFSTRGTGMKVYSTGTLKDAELTKQSIPFAFSQ